MTQGGRAQDYRRFTNRQGLGEYKRPLDCEASNTCTQAELDAYYGKSGNAMSTTNKILNVLSDIWGGYNASQSSGGSNNDPVPPAPVDNTLKYVLITVGVVGAAGIIYAIAKPKPKK